MHSTIACIHYTISIASTLYNTSPIRNYLLYLLYPSTSMEYIHKHTHCIYICMHPRIHTNMHAYIHTNMHACMHTHMYAYTHTYMQAYTHAYMHACIDVCIHGCMHTCMHRYIHACMHRYIHAYLHICIPACIPYYLNATSFKTLYFVYVLSYILLS